MAKVLQRVIGRIWFSYLDDVIVFSTKCFEHAANFRAVFDRIYSAGLKLKPLKCSLFVYKVPYLSHVISVANVSSDPAKLPVLADWLTPKTICEIQSNFKFVNFYGDYISYATKFTAPLYNLNASRICDKSIKLTVEHFESFDKLNR